MHVTMKWSGACLLFFIFYTIQYTAAQCTSADHYQRHYMKTTATTGTRLADAYDVHHVFLDIAMTNTTASISGNVTINAMVSASALDTIVFELSDTLHIDSVKLNGVNRSVSSDNWIRKVALPVSLLQGDDFSLQVFYHGAYGSGGNFIG